MNEHVRPERTVSRQRRAFSLHHVVSFEETNVVGNVYFVRHVAWQGRCRELFLKAHAPQTLQAMASDLRLVTLRVSCDYFEELRALDELEIRMSLAHLRAHKIGLNFEYLVSRGSEPRIVATGFQEIACMLQSGNALVPSEPPPALAQALEQFGASA